MEQFDFKGWATKSGVRCSDGRTITADAFKHNDGKKVPLVWNHQHDIPENVLGWAILKHCAEGMYAYCKFNDTKSGQNAKLLVQHGDVTQLSIYANRLKQDNAKNVMHGEIREVSLVLAGANPKAFIESVNLAHGDGDQGDEVVIYTGENFELAHADEDTNDKEENKMADENKKPEGGEKTVGEVWNGLMAKISEDEKTVIHMMIGEASKRGSAGNDEEENMKHNAFYGDQGEEMMAGGAMMGEPVVSHSDLREIIKLAKSSGVGSLRDAFRIYAEETENDVLQHGFVDEDGEDAINYLYPEYKDVKSGMPEVINRDQGWVTVVMNKTHKSPMSRIRTRQIDARDAGLRGRGFKKGQQKKLNGNTKLLKRTTDPYTIYVKDQLDRDDMVDITEFDVVAYKYGEMTLNLKEEMALAIMVGDGREDGDADKIPEDKIRPIWKDDELFTIHVDLDIAKAKKELQGTNTAANFGVNYIYAEAVLMSMLYARENYKGTGTPDFFCAPHLVNVMLCARDLNGRRIYDTVDDIAKALNVGKIHTAEQFTNLVRTDDDGKQHKLLGLMVSLGDYTVGATKGGQITRFQQFDIDFNREKFLIESRSSGALTCIKSAIALEELVEEAAA
ncbi:MAG: HK97 family phage prohead protease [Oscillospiraceae bacterium]|nr:HK97 family phage prohead protease [Oscillospiraceae bacterium]